MEHPFIPLAFERLSADESRRKARAFLESIRRRRTVRDFSPEAIPMDAVDAAIAAAASAPSGANRQPWRFVVVRDADLKRRIREAAEAEEREFYERRATPEWLADLAPLGTDWHKPFLETAPCHCRRLPARRAPRGRPRHAHPHAFADGLSRRDPGPAQAREAVSARAGRLSGRRRPRARHLEEEPRRSARHPLRSPWPA